MTFDPSRADTEEQSPSNPLGDALTPTLQRECRGRLKDLDWFRSPWQNGGASTAFATWTDDDGRERPALVKVPVGYRELFWTEALANAIADPDRLPTPRVFACGDTLNGYDLAWIVTERLEGPPLAQSPTRQGVLDMLDAAADLHLAAARIRPPMEGVPPPAPDWASLIARARDFCRNKELPHAQRWNAILKKVTKHLPALIEKWEMRPIDTWCHGDLHAANVLRRRLGAALPAGRPLVPVAGEPDRAAGPGDAEDQPSPQADTRAVLIDLAMVHAGCWVEDAVYLERTFWGAPERLCGVRPVNALARKRRERGLPVSDSAAELANIRRVLMAASTLAYHARNRDDAYTDAALAQVEKVLPLLHL